MSELPKGISVATVGDAVYVHVVGRGTFQNSQPLHRYAQEMIDRGYQKFVVDLGQCHGLDSTFLGVLAGIALQLGKQSPVGKLTVINAGALNTELIQTLGLDRLLDIAPADAPVCVLPADATVQVLPDTDISDLSRPLSKHETADLMLDAHDNLIRADHRNLAKFKDLTQVLRDNVAKRNAAPKSPSQQPDQEKNS